MVQQATIAGSPFEKTMELIHATRFEHWESIRTEGLKGEPFISFTAVDHKSVKGCIAGVVAADLLIYVDVQKALQDGIQFSPSSNPQTIVCESNALDVKYFAKVVNIRSGVILWTSKGDEEIHTLTATELRKMKLYSDARIRYTLNTAVSIAYTCGNSLKASDFGFVDQLHYLGYECMDDFFGRYAASLQKMENARAIDIGTGMGGPARYMQEQYGMQVTAIEYLHELVKICRIMNSLLQIPEERFNIIEGDFSHMDVDYMQLEGQFQCLTAQLTFLHISDKEDLFKRCAQVLTDGGYFMIEDYFLADDTELCPEDQQRLKDDVSVPTGVPVTEKRLRALLEDNGLVVEEFEDMTDRWSVFIWERCESFMADRQKLEAEHGVEYIQELGHFYTAVASVFHKLQCDSRIERYPNVCQAVGWSPALETKDQNLRGCRIMGRKKSTFANGAANGVHNGIH
jgi:cyclopropane fatty-acyl-phospholipid synthase-like methyltransferase